MSVNAEQPPTSEAAGIDQAILGMERLYTAVTGSPPPSTDDVPTRIPVERNPGEYVEEQLNRLLELLGADMSPARTAAAVPDFMPPLSVLEAGDETVVRVDLPGVAREDVRVTLNGTVLAISGRRMPPAPDHETVRLVESPFGGFRRVLEIRGVARGAEPTARLKDGVLEVRIAREIPPVPTERPVPVS